MEKMDLKLLRADREDAKELHAMQYDFICLG